MWSLIWFTVVCVTVVAVSSANVKVIDNTVTVASEATSAKQFLTIAEDETSENATTREVIIDEITIRGTESEDIISYFDIPYGEFPEGSPFQVTTLNELLTMCKM